MDHNGMGGTNNGGAENGPMENGEGSEAAAELSRLVRDFDPGSLGHRMGIELVEATPRRVVGTMPVVGNTQPYGLLHGGASAVLAETLGSIGAMLHAGIGHIAVGIELNASHHRSATSGVVTGVATAIHLGRTLASYEIAISGEADRKLCTARLTCLIRPA